MPWCKARPTPIFTEKFTPVTVKIVWMARMKQVSPPRTAWAIFAWHSMWWLCDMLWRLRDLGPLWQEHPSGFDAATGVTGRLSPGTDLMGYIHLCTLGQVIRWLVSPAWCHGCKFSQVETGPVKVWRVKSDGMFHQPMTSDPRALQVDPLWKSFEKEEKRPSLQSLLCRYDRYALKKTNAENLQVFLVGVESKRQQLICELMYMGFSCVSLSLLPKRGRLAFMVGHKLCQPKNASSENDDVHFLHPNAGCELCFSVSGWGLKQQQLYVDEVQKSLYPRKPWRCRCVMAPVFQQRNPSKYSGLLDAWGTIVGYKMPKHIRKIIKRFCLDSV